MSKYQDSHEDGPSDDSGRSAETEETRFMDEGGSNYGAVRSSRSMPVPEYMQRSTDRLQEGDDDKAPPPTYEEAVARSDTPPADAAKGADNSAEGADNSAEGVDDSGLSPEEIAVVLKMQTGRDQYLPESRDSYAEAIEMDGPDKINPDERGEDAPDSGRSLWRESEVGAPAAYTEAQTIRVSELSQESPHYVERGRAPEGRQDFECTSCSVLNAPITLLGRFLKAQSNTRLVLIGILVLALVGLVLFLGLFPASFVYIEYYQVALPQSKMTNVVDREHVFYPGCYVLGPDTTLVRFTASAHTIMEEKRVFTTDTIPITIRFSFVYFLRPGEVGHLYTKFLHDYNEPFKLIASSSIRNLAAGSFTVDQFRFNRTFVERQMHAVVRKRLGGDCCPDCCPKGCQSNLYCEGCKRDGCDQGYHVDVRHFNLLSVSIPTEVFERYLRTTILEIEMEKEFFLQDHAIMQKETQLLTQRYLNDANETISKGTYEAYKIGKVAEAEKEKTVQTSYVAALKGFFTTLKVARPEYKSSLMMIRALEDNVANMYTGYGYNQSTLFAQ